MTEQAKFAYSGLGNEFKKQIKTIENQDEKQMKAIGKQIKQLVKPSDEKDSPILLKQREIFDKLVNEWCHEIQNLSKQINYNNLTCFLPKYFTGFKLPLKFSRYIKDGEITLAKARQSKRF